MRSPRSLLRPAALLGALVLAVTLSAAPGATASAATHGHPAAAAVSYAPAACGTAHHARQAQCYAMVATNAQHRPAVSPADPPTGALGPADIQSAYNLPAGTAGSGETVAIVDAFGDSTAESDLAAFRSYYGMPACGTAIGCFRKVDQTGGTDYPPDSPGTGWALETSLDLDAVSAACPNCSMLLVEANTNAIPDLGAAVDEAVSLGAKFVSNSYGVLGEDASEQSFDPYYDHPGVAVAAATGDYGEITSYPAASPDVISVGGTTLTRDSSVSRGWDEAAWSGGGSGCSLYEPQPTYQQDVSTGCGNRAESDLSADADPNSGLAVYDTLGEGGWMQVGGTSLASPLITAMYALAGTPTPGTNPASYPYLDTHKPADLNDITQGSNGSCGTVLCTAGAGWDGPTGWGSRPWWTCPS
ncbi:MAG TPA: S53 family peptidase [Streptosporangiaceae bacterium]